MYLSVSHREIFYVCLSTLFASWLHLEMFDIRLRSIKDGIFDPICAYIPRVISPTQITILAFLSGLLSCLFATRQRVLMSLIFWFLNRALDCLDGALARHRDKASDLGGFLDLLGDFIVYSMLPMGIAYGSDDSSASWQAIAVLESTFHINNFILFYIAAVAEKGQAKNGKASPELTSVMMRPALVEGMESALLFTAMLAVPTSIGTLCWTMAVLVCIGIAQRTFWIIGALA